MSIKWKKAREGHSSTILSIARCDGVVQHYDTKEKKIIHTDSIQVEQNNGLRSLEYTASASEYMVGGTNKNVYLYDAETFQHKTTFGSDRMKIENHGKIT